MREGEEGQPRPRHRPHQPRLYCRSAGEEVGAVQQRARYLQHLRVPDQLIHILLCHIQLAGVDKEQEQPEDVGGHAGKVQGVRAGGERELV